MVNMTAWSKLKGIAGIFACTLFLFSANGYTIGEMPSELRLISLSPNLTELAFSAGLGEQLVGVSDYSDYPAQAKRLPIVSNANGMNLEFILSLNPNMILAQQVMISNSTVEKLSKMGLEIEWMSIKTVDDLYAAINSLAKISPKPSQADQTLAKIKSEINEIESIAKRATPRTVFLELSDAPLLTTNHSSLIHDLLARCHLNLLFSEETAPWPLVSFEGIIAGEPDLILISTPRENLSGPELAFEEVTLSGHPKHENAHLTRYRTYLPQANVIRLNADIFTRETPRLVSGVLSLCRHLQAN